MCTYMQTYTPPERRPETTADHLQPSQYLAFSLTWPGGIRRSSGCALGFLLRDVPSDETLLLYDRCPKLSDMSRDVCLVVFLLRLPSCVRQVTLAYNTKNEQPAEPRAVVCSNAFACPARATALQHSTGARFVTRLTASYPGPRSRLENDFQSYSCSGICNCDNRHAAHAAYPRTTGSCFYT